MLLLGIAPLASAAERTMPDDLPSVRGLPDLFTLGDGSKVASKETWAKRRDELKELVLTYEYGHLPPVAPVQAVEHTWTPAGEKALKGEAKRKIDPIDLPQGATETHLVLRTGPEGKIQIPVVLTRPAGKGPFPAIIRGDLCWGRVTTQIAAEVINRGYILAEFDRTAIVPDENVGRDVGLYAVYPQQDFGALAAWAWGFHRVVDYLLTRDDVQKDHIAVTGHSRGGKTALLAGATDERIALTVPNNSGCGGAGCFRYQGEKCETIDVITRRFPFWFQAQFNEFVGKVDRLPIDQHAVKALVAPRALLSNEALGDEWANPEGSQHTYLAAKKAYDLLGASDKIAITFRPGVHEQNLGDWKTLLDFADLQFAGKKSARKFDQLAFPENRLSPDPARNVWNQFLGPYGNNISDSRNLPVQWSEEENVVWKTAIHGKAWSSPVILGKHIWLSTATEDGRKLGFVCVDKETGRIVRDQKLFDVEKPQYCHPFNSYASPTPVIEPGRIYITYGDSGTACVDTETFKVLWERRDLHCIHYRGPGSSPLLFRDMLIMHFDGSDQQYVVALDQKTGATRWKTPRSVDFEDLDDDGRIQREGDMRKAFSTPRISTLSGQPLIVSLGSKCLYAYEPAGGKEIWRLENRASHSGSPTPFVGDEFIYYCTGLGNETLCAIKPGGKGVLDNSHIAWKVKKNVTGRPSPILFDNRIYMVTDAGIASCIDAKTGEEVWKERIAGNYSATPLYADGRIYFCNEDGMTTVIEAGPKFKKLAENELDDGFMASPAVAEHALILRTKTHLYRVEAKKS